MNHLIGQHSAFVFGVKSVAFGSYISCGDDKSIRIWHNESVIQTLQCPASVWSVALD